MLAHVGHDSNGLALGFCSPHPIFSQVWCPEGRKAPVCACQVNEVREKWVFKFQYAQEPPGPPTKNAESRASTETLILWDWGGA